MRSFTLASMVAHSAETAGADPLADLGLYITAPENTDGIPAASAEAKQPREAVQIGAQEVEYEDFIPAMRRGGGGGAKGSKYDFDSLVAPVEKDDKSGYRYAVLKIDNVPGQDETRFSRSVQSAVTAENRKNKEAGSPVRYLTRTRVVAGAFAGMSVYRVDGTQDTEEAAA